MADLLRFDEVVASKEEQYIARRLLEIRHLLVCGRRTAAETRAELRELADPKPPKPCWGIDT